MTLLCVPIFVEDIESAISDAVEARHRGADLVELRIDSYYSGSDDEQQVPELVRLLQRCPLPCIVTCRPVLEGGQYDGPDDARISVLERLCAAARAGEHPPRYVDVELATYTRSQNIRQKVNLCVDHEGQLRAVDTGLILSSHDFQGRPADLFRTISLMAGEAACRVSKVAYRARSLRDNLELLDVLSESHELGRPMIALGMGPFGMMSRVLAGKFDGFLTFASLRRSSATAPGQPTLDELLGLYRFRSISRNTKVYGVIGWPVEHSISPQVHNAAFESRGHDGVYMHLPVAAGYEPFKATLLAMADHPMLDFCGCSVTIPHKENLVALAREMIEAGDDRWTLDPLSVACGAANTLTIERDGKGQALKFAVANSDGPGAAGALRDALGTLVGQTVLVLGAGGTARALAASVVLEGGKVAVSNRTPERAAELCAQLRDALRCDPAHLHAVADEDELAELAAGKAAAVFNCTSAGMAGGGSQGQLPASEEFVAALHRHCVVAESVYRPLMTPLLAAATGRGLQTINGLQLFVRQAAEQSRWWTGQEPSSALMMQVAREAMQIDAESAE